MMAEARLLGPDGLPVRRQALTEEAVTPSITGVRHIFDEFVAAGLTPGRLAQVLRDASQGDMLEFLTLAEEMEEREFQYRSVLGTRKTAIKSIEPFVKAASEDAEDVALADAVKDELVDRPEFRHLVGDLLDALGKGYSVAEIIWRLDARRWSVERFEWRDPRLFHFDRETRKTLRIRSASDHDGLPLAPFKFVVHVPRLKSGLPARNGLARIAAWAYMLKSFTLKDWASFLEIHGMPLRVGKYGPGASAEDRRVLLRAVRDMGADAAAIIPESMAIEFQQVSGFSDKPFEGFAGYLDKQVSKVILGQTMTADDGSSKAQAAVHDKVRVDIKEDDAADLAHTINQHLMRPWVDINYGPRPRNRYPQLVFPVMEREDLQIYGRAIGELVDRGLEIEQAEVLDRIGHRLPAKGAAILRAKGAPGAGREAGDKPEKPPGGGDGDDEDGGDEDSGQTAAAAGRWRLDPRSCPGCGAAAPAGLAAAGPSAQDPAAQEPADELDRLVDEELGRFERVMEPVRDALEQAFAQASDFEDLDRRLAALAASLPVGELARRMAAMNLKALGLGRAGSDIDYD
jgi:phage gp29-like protein